MIKVRINKLHGFILNKRERLLVSTYTPHIQSQAALILLKQEYVRAENKDAPKEEWRIWLTFRNRYLRRMKKLHKRLDCAYCNKTNLFMNNNTPQAFAQKKQATVDHIVPKSKGGKEYDESNFAISCAECNGKKADIMPNEFNINKHQSKKSIIVLAA